MRSTTLLSNCRRAAAARHAVNQTAPNRKSARWNRAASRLGKNQNSLYPILWRRLPGLGAGAVEKSAASSPGLRQRDRATDASAMALRRLRWRALAPLAARRTSSIVPTTARRHGVCSSNCIHERTSSTAALITVESAKQTWRWD